MRKLLFYRSPQTIWSDIELDKLICDSYDSGIDDLDYEDIDWTVQP